MAVVSAPLLSFGASGQVAKSMVYASWKGRPYVRRFTIPSNPQSSGQTLTRSAFSWLNSVWKVAPENFRTAWVAAAKGQVLTDRNLFIKQNLPTLRPQADLTGLVMSPSAKGGLIGDITVTPGAGQITVAGVPPSPLPSGWTVIRMIAAIIKQQDPQSGTDFDVLVMEDLTSPYSVVFTQPGSAEHWMAGAWFEYQKSALATDLAYGPSVGVDTLTT